VTGGPGSAAVVHDEAAARFELDTPHGSAVCAYVRRGDVVHFVHTEVPAALQGHGLAARLVAHALDWARAAGLKVRPACSYVALYMRRHPEARDLLAP
jgi:hypothetical protein